jgi:hypothetical protein
MMFAGHLPTREFNQQEWLAMPVWTPTGSGDFPPEGFYRSELRGKPIVGFFAYTERGYYDSWAVRPVVRVKMGRA